VLYLSEKAAPRLERLHLDRFDHLFSLEGPYLDRNRLRDVIRIETPGGSLYRKRQHGIKARDHVRAALRGRRLRSHSREEARHLVQLQERGFRVPVPAGLGEGSRGRSLLLVEELEGDPLPNLLEAEAEVEAAAGALAALVHGLLEARIYWPDLDARHVFLRPGPEGLEAGFLDVQRLNVGDPLRTKARSKMLDRLDRSLGPGKAGRLVFQRVQEVLAG